MKTKVMISGCVISVIVFFTGYQYSRAESSAEGLCLRVGVVSIRTVFRQGRRIARYRNEFTAERQRTQSRLAELGKEIEIEQAGLKVLKPESNDYLLKLKSILDKQAQLETEKNFYNKRMSLAEQRMTGQLYKDILEQTKLVAEEKGLDLVFEQSVPEIPASSPAQLELAMGTHKVLYSGGCVDITEEVLARVDAQESSELPTEPPKPLQ